MIHNNTICIELEVAAVLWNKDMHLQGDVSIKFNSEHPYVGEYIVDETALLKRLECDGNYFILSCSCGLPECSGWKKGIEESYHDSVVKWIDL
jgi:hypothetical protein